MPDTQDTCPSTEQLQAFLSETLADTTLQQMTSHINSCGACQARLEELVAKIPESLISPTELGRAQAKTYIESEHQTTPRSNESDLIDSIAIPGIEVKQLIGRGGMGMVFQARQTSPVERTVALKLIRHGLVHPEFDHRFQRERSLLASIEHPHVARLYDAGQLTNGTPWFLMEFVEGQNLVEFSRENRLGIEQRVELILQICRAVQHLHSRQIIHRDLKPDNILVTSVAGVPTAKLIDFGLAKLLDPESAGAESDTLGSSPLGTPRYMSPEQTGLRDALTELDTTTDVYSLGIVLYELMTGDTPIDRDTVKNSDIVEILAQIRTLDPVKPSRRIADHKPASEQHARAMGLSTQQLRQQLDSDLDWIILKAIQKERSRRYTTVEAFAHDLENYLANLPVSARPPSKRYLAQKFYRRNKSLVWFAALLLVTLSAGLIGTAIGMFEAQNAEKLASDAAIREAAAHEQTEQLRLKEKAARLQTESTLENLRSATGILQTVFEGFNPEAINSSEAELRTVLLERLKVAATSLMEVSLGEGDDVYTLKFELAKSVSALGENEIAIKLLENIMAELPSAKSISLEDQLALTSTLAMTCMKNGNNDRAVELTTEAKARAAAAYPEDHPYRLAMLQYHALAVGATGDKEAAIAAFEEIVDRDPPETPDEAFMYHNTWNNLAVEYHRANRPEEAAEAYRKSLNYFENRLDESHPMILTMRSNLAMALAASGQTQQGIDELRNVLATNVRRFPAASPNVGEARINLAVSLAKVGETEEACTLLKQVVSTTGSEQTKLRAELQLMGTQLLVMRSPDIKISDFEALAKRIASTLGENHLVTQTANQLLQQARQQGDGAEPETSEADGRTL